MFISRICLQNDSKNDKDIDARRFSEINDLGSETNS